MTSTTSTNGQQASAARQGRMIPTSSAVMYVVVRVAGIVPVRLDLTHVGTPEQELSLSLGTVLAYVRSAVTARVVAEHWGQAAEKARSLAAAVPGRRPVAVGPSTVAAMVRLAGMPKVTAGLEPARPATRGRAGMPAMLRITTGPVAWEICDATAYSCMLRAWRQAARLLGENLKEDEE